MGSSFPTGYAGDGFWTSSTLAGSWTPTSPATGTATGVVAIDTAEKIPINAAGEYAAVDVARWKGATAPAMTGDAFARLGPPAGASIAADIAAKPTAAQISAQVVADFAAQSYVYYVFSA